MLLEPQEPQVPPEPQGHLAPPTPRASFVEADMTYTELQASLINLTQLMTTQAHVSSITLSANLTKEIGPNQMLVLPPIGFGI